MEQSETPASKPNVIWLAIVSLIFCLLPFIWVVGTYVHIIPLTENLFVFVSIAWLGSLVFLIPLAIISKRIKFPRFEPLSLDLPVVCLLLFLVNTFMILSLPGYIRMQGRSKEGVVRVVASTLRERIEVYKVKNKGQRPGSILDVEPILADSVKIKNPFNSKQIYTVSGGGLVDGEPSQDGVIGYIAPKDSFELYKIIFFTEPVGFKRRDTFLLVEEGLKSKKEPEGLRRP